MQVTSDNSARASVFTAEAPKAEEGNVQKEDAQGRQFACGSSGGVVWIVLVRVKKKKRKADSSPVVLAVV